MTDEALESMLANAVPPHPEPRPFDQIWASTRRRRLRRRVVAGVVCAVVVAAVSATSMAMMGEYSTRDGRVPAAAGEPAPYATDAQEPLPVVECGDGPSISTVPYASDVYGSPSEAGATQLSALDVDESKLDSGRYSGTNDSGRYSFSSDEGTQVVVAVERSDAGWRIVSIEYCAGVVSEDEK